jgi:hypothetical protein
MMFDMLPIFRDICVENYLCVTKMPRLVNIEATLIALVGIAGDGKPA